MFVQIYADQQAVGCRRGAAYFAEKSHCASGAKLPTDEPSHSASREPVICVEMGQSYVVGCGTKR